VLTPEREVGAETGTCRLRASLEPAHGEHLPRLEEDHAAHRRAGLRETTSDYLIRDPERGGVAVRDRSEIAEPHGADGDSKVRSG
jgi:hypothetical protein